MSDQAILAIICTMIGIVVGFILGRIDV